MYRQLDPERIVETIRTLTSRIERRFASSGLSEVSRELLDVGREATTLAASLGRPIVPLRIGVLVLIAAIVALAIVPFTMLNLAGGIDDIGDFIQIIEAGVNDVVFLALGIFFLATLEGRIKRHRALRALRELRSIAHVVDMHQLTKDPELVIDVSGEDMEPGAPVMSRAELARYLDYSSEMLSLVSKVAALYVQDFDDSVVLGAVNEIESLTTGLSRKVWQKIMILDAIDAPSLGRPLSSQDRRGA